MRFCKLFLFTVGLLFTEVLFSQADYVFYDESKGFIGGSVYGRLIDTKGRVWFGTEEGISMFENDKLTTWKKGESGLSTSEGPFFFVDYGDGLVIASTSMRRIVTIWGECADDMYFYPHGYHVFVEGKWKYYENTFKDSPVDADQCFEHPGSNIWFVSQNYGVAVYPQVKVYNMHEDHFPIVDITNKAPDPPYYTFHYNGYYLWIAKEEGLYCFDYSENVWKEYLGKKEFKEIKNIYTIGKEAVLVNYKDVTLFSNGNFITLDPKLKLGGLHCYEQHIDPKDSSIWVASDKGMLHFKDGKIERFLENQDFTQIIPYGNGFITASIGGLFVYDGKEFKQYKNKVLADPVWLRKIGDEVWMLNRKYIYYTDKGEVKELWPDVMKDAKTQLNDKLDTIMTKPNGDILFTMRTVRESNSIYVCHKDMSWTEYEIPNKNKFIALSVKSLLTDDFDLYMATSIGLFVLTDAGLQILLPWDNGIRGNQMEHFFTSKWIVCSNEGVIHFPKGLCR